MATGLGAAALALLLGGCEFLPQSALAKLDPAPQLPPTQGSGTYINMGRQLLRSNQPDLAQDAFIRSIQSEGLSAAALNGAGLASEKLGLLRDAQRFFERAANLEPNSVTAQNNLGVALYRLGEYHAAKRAFQAAYALSSATSSVAEQNIGLTDIAILRVENEGIALAPNPVPLQRRGTGEYILGTPTGTEQDG
ncbi:MAG: tetratricopeptide repeat protein [Paracoccaceae bacterium]